MKKCLGIGNDILELKRLKEAIEEHGQKFLDRIYTKSEQAYCLKRKDPYPALAGRFAAKEAIVKALGCGFGQIASWQDIEITSDDKGRPVPHLSENLRKQFSDPEIHLSLSHDKHYAIATAIAFG